MIFTATVFTLPGCGGGGGGSAPPVITGVTGNVYVVGTVTPVDGARVAVGGVSYTTGADGSFTLTGLSAGPTTLTANKDGYWLATVPVTIVTGQVIQQNVQMFSTDLPPPPPL